MAIVVIVLGLITAWLIGYMYIMFLRILLANPGSNPKTNIYNSIPRMRKYNANDFYDEPDGFYVTMPDGSVRIDD
jgi:hypothetical protein